MESTRTAFNISIKSLGTFFQVILSRTLPLATPSSVVTVLLAKSVALVTSIPHFILAIFQNVRSPSCFRGCRPLDVLRPRNCPVWATLITCLALFLTWFTLRVAFDSLRLAEWTARKEYTLLCRDEASREISEQCGIAANLSLPPPPGFPTHLTKRGFVGWTGDYLADDLVFGNYTPWHLHDRHHVLHNRTASGPPRPDRGWCRELRLFSVFFPTLMAVFSVHRDCGAMPHGVSLPDCVKPAMRAGPRAAISRNSEIQTMREFQFLLITAYMVLFPDLCDNTARPHVWRALAPLRHDVKEIVIVQVVFSAAIMVLPLVYAILLFAIQPYYRLWRRPLAFKHQNFIYCLVQEATYLSTVPLPVFLATWPAGDRAPVVALLFSSWTLGRCGAGGNFDHYEDGFPGWLRVCNDCGQMEDDLEGRVLTWSEGQKTYGVEVAMSSNPMRKQWFCHQCACSYKKRV